MSVNTERKKKEKNINWALHNARKQDSWQVELQAYFISVDLNEKYREKERKNIDNSRFTSIIFKWKKKR
jgi:hypothetical protein